jgi:hypothetical protein
MALQKYGALLAEAAITAIQSPKRQRYSSINKTPPSAANCVLQRGKSKE